MTPLVLQSDETQMKVVNTESGREPEAVENLPPGFTKALNNDRSFLLWRDIGFFTFMVPFENRSTDELVLRLVCVKDGHLPFC